MRSYIFDKKEKGVFSLLKNCISDDCTRMNLCHSYYDGNGNIYATNGRKLVKISSKRLIEKLGDNPGYFDISGSVLIESDFDNKPIEYERVIPAGDGEKFVLPKTTTVKQKYMDSFIYAAVCYYTRKTFDPELFQGVKEIEWKEIYQKNDGYVVRLNGSIIDGYLVTYVAMAMNTPFMDKSEPVQKTA